MHVPPCLLKRDALLLRNRQRVFSWLQFDQRPESVALKMNAGFQKPGVLFETGNSTANSELVDFIYRH